MKKIIYIVTTSIVFGGFSNAANAVYLNYENISVSLGNSMTTEPFSNRSSLGSLASIIDASTALSSEEHNQQTHVWVSGGTLELDFDFGAEYNLTSIQFWNFFGEGWDVDNIDFNFYDSSNEFVGNLLNVTPQLGGAGGNPIFAENINLLFPSSVQYVNAVLSGSNGQVDFNNIGFTAELSQVPLPTSVWLFGSGLVGLAGLARRRGKVEV